jgi:hypothetical protein
MIVADRRSTAAVRAFQVKAIAKMSLGTADASVRSTSWRTLQRAASALVPTRGAGSPEGVDAQTGIAQEKPPAEP